MQDRAASSSDSVRPGASSISLTHREREVLLLASQGLADKQIAQRLGMERRTVTTHMCHIFHKLGTNNRTGAVITAAALGIISLG